MISKKNKNADRKARHTRVRKIVSGTAARPRLCVYRSLNNISVQVIDDDLGHTLCACSTVEKDIKAATADMTKSDAAQYVGKVIAQRALEKNIKSVVFDRGGYLYTGRVAMVAAGAREGGLDF